MKEKYPELSIRRAMLDFERAAINGIKSVFPDVIVNCCFFHLSQNLFRKIGQYHLRAKYVNDVDFAHGIKMIAALAFVPPAKVFFE